MRHRSRQKEVEVSLHTSYRYAAGAESWLGSAGLENHPRPSLREESARGVAPGVEGRDGKHSRTVQLSYQRSPGSGKMGNKLLRSPAEASSAPPFKILFGRRRRAGQRQV